MHVLPSSSSWTSSFMLSFFFLCVRTWLRVHEQILFPPQFQGLLTVFLYSWIHAMFPWFYLTFQVTLSSWLSIESRIERKNNFVKKSESEKKDQNELGERDGEVDLRQFNL
jgi:hypothetical protein